MSILAWLPVIREIVGLGQSIADNVRARHAERRQSAKPCIPPPPPARRTTTGKQAPRQDGKR